ncbi:bacteriocin immunity protein [Pectobacterium brasiliense]|uniref:Bacteriocin immunity protein n=1 Tax=Pectobacterium brasiliense TaxID=180957 RepID=A0AAW9HDF7_9GAMM|nr:MULTISPECIES: bacteriocin immunity protein [Pectobacterium]MDY4379302.1 bacteriocin immunity protein [Pectobacterium brasiliense]PXB03889.1 bacteriocin immunity protein [Pectobacterium carotovorum subsp. carotovorum]
MKMKNNFSEYTKKEFINLISEICDANGDDEHQDFLLEHLIKITEYASVSDVIYYPSDGDDDSPEGISNAIIKWRRSRNLPLFKDSD